MNLFKSNKLVGVATLVTATFATLSLATTNKAQAAIIFTSNIGVQNFVFSASPGDGLIDLSSQASDTNNGINVKAPFPIAYTDSNNDGKGVLSLTILTRNFDVIPKSKIFLTLNVNGQFQSLTNQALTITPSISALNNVGGDPYITYSLPVAVGVKGNLIFNKTEQSAIETTQGGLELFGNFEIAGPNGFGVQFTFPNSIDASVSAPEPTSALGLLVLGTLGAASTLKRKLKPSKTSEKETTKVS